MTEQFRNIKSIVVDANIGVTKETNLSQSSGLTVDANLILPVAVSMAHTLGMPTVVGSIAAPTGSYDNLFAFVTTQTTSIDYTGYAGNVTQVAPGNDNEGDSTWITRNGGTFRLEQTLDWTDNARTRNVNNKHLAGFLFTANSISDVYLVDIALEPGTYRVRMGMGFDSSFAEGNRTKVLIRDGMSAANVLQTLTVNSTGTNFGCGVDGVRTHTNSYLALGYDNEPFVDVTLTNSFMRFEVGYMDGNGETSSVNYIRLKRI